MPLARAVGERKLAFANMFRRRIPESATDDVALAAIRAKLTLSMARTNQVPWITVPTGVVLVALFISGQETSVSLSMVSNVSLTFAVPAGVAKILWDRSQKKRQRARISQLEKSNERLDAECTRLKDEIDRLRESRLDRGHGGGPH